MATKQNENTEQVEDNTPVFKAEDVLTPTQLAKEVDVPPQMIYSYLQAGRIKGVEGKIEDTDRVRRLILRETADEWKEGYLERKAAREAKAEELLQDDNTESVDVEA